MIAPAPLPLRADPLGASLDRLARILAIGFAVCAIIYLLVGVKPAALTLLGLLTLLCIGYAANDFRVALAAFAFLLPLEHPLTALGGARWNFLSYLFLGISAIGLLRHHRKGPAWRTALPEYCIAAFLGWEAISIAWTSAGANSGIGLVLTDVAGAAVMMIYARWAGSPLLVLRWLHFYLAGNLVYALVLWHNIRVGAATVWSEERGREIDSMMGAQLDISPNLFARTCIVGTIAALAVVEFDPKQLHRRIAGALAVFFGVSVPLSYGRTSLAAALAALAAWAIFGQKMSSRLRRIGVLVTLSAALLVVAGLINPELFQRRVMQTVTDFSTGDMHQLSTGRAGIWSTAIDLFQDNPLAGSGIGSFGMTYAARTGDIARDAHNIYLRIAVEMGMIGAGLFIAFIVSLGVVAWRGGPWRHFTVAWWITFVVVVAGAASSRAKEFWLAFGLTLFLSRAFGRPSGPLVVRRHPALSVRSRPAPVTARRLLP